MQACSVLSLDCSIKIDFSRCIFYRSEHLLKIRSAAKLFNESYFIHHLWTDTTINKARKLVINVSKAHVINFINDFSSFIIGCKSIRACFWHTHNLLLLFNSTNEFYYDRNILISSFLSTGKKIISIFLCHIYIRSTVYETEFLNNMFAYRKIVFKAELSICSSCCYFILFIMKHTEIGTCIVVASKFSCNFCGYTTIFSTLLYYRNKA